jgi:hypothetical protein
MSSPARRSSLFAENFVFVGYHDLGGRPAFKLAMQVCGRSLVPLCGSLLGPRLERARRDRAVGAQAGSLRCRPGEHRNLQVQVAAGLMLTSLEKPPTELLRRAPWTAWPGCS